MTRRNTDSDQTPDTRGFQKQKCPLQETTIAINFNGEETRWPTNCGKEKHKAF
jgi:hypothetical protein